MSGGIFTDRPFSSNLKCIVFGFLISLIYAYHVSEMNRVGDTDKSPNWLIIALIFIVAYVAMAWYDYAYQCQDYMYAGSTPITVLGGAIFKPQLRVAPTGDTPSPKGQVTVDRTFSKLYGYPSSKAQLVANQEKKYLEKVYFFHAIAVAPLLIYVGAYKGASNPNVWGYLTGLGAMAGMYHGMRIFYPREVWA